MKGQSLLSSFRRHLNATFFVIFSAFVLNACGGGNNEQAQIEEGQVLVSLTDAEGDFVNYTVDVLSIKLQKADGTQVEVLPMHTRVDFAAYTEMTEFLTAASVPRGVYTKGSLVLDYSNADIWVEDNTGAAQQVTEYLDTTGTPLTTLEVSVNLEGRGSLPIVPGIPKNLMLDFDLKQSNTVSFGEEISMTVAPVIVVDIDPQAPKIHRTRGPLKSVSVAESQFEIYIRPFFHPIRIGQRVFGSLHVKTNDQTFYEIDGITYQGVDGLTVLNTMSPLTAVIAVGDLKFAPLRFEATEVYAGSSVPGGDLDVVRGVVTSRTADDKIVVKGATLFRTDGAVLFNDQVTVQLDDSTRVTKQMHLGTFNIDDISVGQRITVFGTITNDQVSDLQMSAANGYARMRLSSVHGDVVQLPLGNSIMTMNIDAINGRNVSIYNFAGTGLDAGSDSDPANYEVDTGTLSLDNMLAGDVVSVRGFPTAFGTAPADFTAQSIIKP